MDAWGFIDYFLHEGKDFDQELIDIPKRINKFCSLIRKDSIEIKVFMIGNFHQEGSSQELHMTKQEVCIENVEKFRTIGHNVK